MLDKAIAKAATLVSGVGGVKSSGLVEKDILLSRFPGREDEAVTLLRSSTKITPLAVLHIKATFVQNNGQFSSA